MNLCSSLVDLEVYPKRACPEYPALRLVVGNRRALVLMQCNALILAGARDVVRKQGKVAGVAKSLEIGRNVYDRALRQEQ